jgi:UDP-glucuronate 4-epimerase
MQQGDVPKTFADITDLINDYNYKPNVPITYGISKFIKWYKDYNNNFIL